MRNFLAKWFSGPRFWTLLGIVELLLLFTNLITPYMSEVLEAWSIVIMWIAFATSEILAKLNEPKDS